MEERCVLLSALMRRPSHADRDALPQSHFQDDSSAANHGGSGSVALEKLPVILGARRLPAALSERSAPGTEQLHPGAKEYQRPVHHWRAHSTL